MRQRNGVLKHGGGVENGGGGSNYGSSDCDDDYDTLNIRTSSWQKWRIINSSRKNSEHVATR
jgi:hypothetical protein